MKRSRFSEEQLAHARRQTESGTAVAEVSRQIGVREATSYVWKKKYAHLGVSELRRQLDLKPSRNRSNVTCGRVPF